MIRDRNGLPLRMRLEVLKLEFEVGWEEDAKSALPALLYSSEARKFRVKPAVELSLGSAHKLTNDHLTK